jgi:AcrR family transcriptional regulator
MVRISKTPEERKQEIIKVSQVLFLEKGYLQTKVSDIVKYIGVSQGIFYYYFPSKEAVVEEIIDLYMNIHLNEARSVLKKDDLSPLEKLEEMANRQLGINQRENNNIHAIKGVDIHERILNRLVIDYIPLMLEAFDKTGDEFTRFRFEVFVTAGNVLFDPGIFSWSISERNKRIDGLISMMEESLEQPEGSFSFYRGLMGYA